MNRNTRFPQTPNQGLDFVLDRMGASHIEILPE
jgi:hypothetical protein